MYNIFMEIRKVIYEKLQKLTSQKLDDNSDIYNIGIDSLDLVELVTEAEDLFDVIISDEDLMSFKTIGDIIKGFEKLLK